MKVDKAQSCPLLWSSSFRIDLNPETCQEVFVFDECTEKLLSMWGGPLATPFGGNAHPPWHTFGGGARSSVSLAMLAQYASGRHHRSPAFGFRHTVWHVQCKAGRWSLYLGTRTLRTRLPLTLSGFQQPGITPCYPSRAGPVHGQSFCKHCPSAFCHGYGVKGRVVELEALTCLLMDGIAHAICSICKLDHISVSALL